MQPIPESIQKNRKRYLQAGIIAGLIVVVFGIDYFVFSAPKEFREETVVHVVPGSGLSTIAETLESNHIIKSAFWFKVLTTLEGGQNKSIAGEYVFHKPAGMWNVTRRLITGDLQSNLVKVTFPEGITMKTMSGILATSSIRSFNTKAFLASTKTLEGYLFPDTYFFPDTSTSSQIIEQMKNNFDAQIKPLLPEVYKSGHSLAEIINMASLLEEEAKGETNQRIVSGILWKRISEGMFLQIDAPFTYTTGRTSEEVTLKDLQSNSPYNTYTHKGLPPTPISNPGLTAIKAALNPTPSPYYFFISDKQGVMHYAKTGTEHQRNVDKYLR